jgi:hypothetical protein
MGMRIDHVVEPKTVIVSDRGITPEFSFEGSISTARRGHSQAIT